MSDPSLTVVAMEPLTDRERAILDFENSTQWRHQGSKEDAVRDLFDLKPIRYFQVLNALIDKPAAMVEFPVVVKRLQRLRDSRRRRRAG